ncbi:SOS response-associated peptidase [Tautonia plasticadhaerens]|uniref:Abasic site processing protein n=1 Tax=Tautonia plasticadhaerens TaxID=2527974 RepID=A0A518H7Y2_9BACT|nr:SOS response-associated peptidase [Tautonia plasticadhaerens]QDV36944.1 Putative SOS response-associated peptidase YedK [Tautonia plasticadhaerens]
MCGRYTLRAKRETIAEAFDLPEVPELPARYNIAPTQDVPVVRPGPDQGHRTLCLLHWGLIPSWADDPSIGNKMINARAETVAEKPAFRHAFKTKRCLVVADGFYEWRREGKHKRPYFIRMKDDRPFAFAGLWERWDKGGGPIESCTLITGEPNEVVAPVHDRMPVILHDSDYDIWLDPEVTDPKMLRPLLVPYPAEEMEAYPVSTLVNSPANDVDECIERVG